MILNTCRFVWRLAYPHYCKSEGAGLGGTRLYSVVSCRRRWPRGVRRWCPPGPAGPLLKSTTPPERADTLSCAAFAPRDFYVFGFPQVLRGRCRLLALAVLDRSAVCAVLSYGCYVYLSGRCVLRAAPLLKLKVCSSSGSRFRRCRPAAIMRPLDLASRENGRLELLWPIGAS